MSPQSGCAACNRIDAIRRGEDPYFIAELAQSFCVLHKHQAYPGWCVLLLKDHAEHLTDISVECQMSLWSDAARTADAITRAFAPVRLNYECLGNVLPHVHWHIIPRYRPPLDPEPGATVWVRPAAELDSGVSDADRSAFIARLREAGLR